MIIDDAFAVAGIALLFIAFLLNAARKVKRYTYTYNLMNMVGAALLTVYALQINALVFAALEGIWTMVATYFVLHKAVRRGYVTGAWDEDPPWAGENKDLRSVGSGDSGGAGTWEDDGADLRSVGSVIPKLRKRRRIIRRKKKRPEKTAGESTTVWPWQQ